MKRLAPPFLILALAIASPAIAKAPHFSYKKPSIVPGKSIGGVKVGMTRHQAVAAWGAPDTCVPFENTTNCQYLAGANSPFADFYLKGGKVVAVEVDLPGNNQSAAAKAKRLKTAKGIGVGSAAADVRAKYPTLPQGGGEAGLSRNELKKGGRCTQFYAPAAPYTTITSIQLGLCGAIVNLQF